MQLSAEITLYPLQEDYLTAIKATIEKINTFSGLKIQTFPTATIIMGEYQQVMSAIQETVRWSYENYGKCVFIVKYLPDYEALSS
ncbi:YkoF family thiamine/hydroxymethylpyrimidine-binding protein [Teredinibacter sp. KSP-S5-2]|uniref:YkoF family thiamine/hydroxymethylpyrimidine-binding protein n=1 Tax=Teredinibacter sp. KSP-S5-2 TaxID=3034506 RepID=UPI0029347DA9|nr:YkoF family thiamine/hydroxymethylpyrimidine-binding protein [Teredinibacter sp. KSP-S5-2]WNO10172.1 YkoF family thiamine/hydroxymethylpyrimidine-binding protein [Teredinibacter sp. KSP-S5-2]